MAGGKSDPSSSSVAGGGAVGSAVGVAVAGGSTGAAGLAATSLNKCTLPDEIKAYFNEITKNRKEIVEAEKNVSPQSISVGSISTGSGEFI